MYTFIYVIIMYNLHMCGAHLVEAVGLVGAPALAPLVLLAASGTTRRHARGHGRRFGPGPAHECFRVVCV